MRILNNY